MALVDAQPRTIQDLCEEFASIGESAVDPLEIACALEFEGVNDSAAQQAYGFSDVFTLAEEIFARIPRRPAEPEGPSDPWQFSRFRPALHGLLYGLPAVCFPAAAGLLAGPNALTVLIVALLAAWTLSQALAYLGYRRLMPNDTAPARRILRAGLIVGTGLAFVTMAIAALSLHAHLPVVWFGVGEAAYMLGASVLFVLGKERLVFVALAPGVISSAIFLGLGKPAGLTHLIWGVLALSPVLAVLLGLGCTRVPKSPASRLFPSSELRNALPTAGFGLTAAGLLAFPAAAGLHGHGGVNPGVLLATLPISLSMGGAEWCLLWFRRRTQQLLRTTSDLRWFAIRARLVLALAVLQYAGMAVVLIVVAVAIAGSVGLLHPHPTDIPQLVAYLLLGMAMFLALT
ncbi:MAG: hypothetical protein ABSG36_15665, partial [Acidimicrobiales bacterium]